MKVLVICDGPSSSCTNNMSGVAKYSKHELLIRHWNPKPYLTGDIEIVYFHYGGFFGQRAYSYLLPMLSNRSEKWVAGILGPQNFKLWTKDFRLIRTSFKSFVYDLDAITVSNDHYKRLVQKIDNQLRIYVCPCGVDTELFTKTEPPSGFCIGTCDSTKLFMGLPFEKRIARGGIPFRKMPNFYRSISVYVETTRQFAPCGLSLLEAAASGRPVVALRCGMLTEWIPDEMLANNYEELKAIITRLKNNVSFYRKMSILFRQLALSRWSFKNVVAKYDMMFEEVAGG